MENRRMPRIAICGAGESGKDTVAVWLSKHTPLRLGKSTSQVIAPYVAEALGVSVEKAFNNRRKNRGVWFAMGNDLRKSDPAFLIREALKEGDIAVGPRNREEIIQARKEKLIDLAIWIDRVVPADPSMTFGPELCDFSINNRGTLEELYKRLWCVYFWAGEMVMDRA